MSKMKFLLSFVLIFLARGINGQNLDDFQILSQCDRTVGSGVAACMQYFSPIKFVTDFLNSDKDSLCCTHFRQNACIRGVRDAVRVAKAANLCPDSYADALVSSVTDSAVNEWIVKKCRTFNAQKCVMDSVGDVMNTIQGFFIPQQQKPVIPQLIQRVPQLFSRGVGNVYSADDNQKNHNFNRNNDYNNAGTDLINPIRELFNRRVPTTTTTTPNPFIQTIGNIYGREYIPEASDVKPVKQSGLEVDPLRSLFGGLGLLNNNRKEKKDETTAKEDNSGVQPSLLSGFGTLLNTGLDMINNNRTANGNSNDNNFFGNIFNLNDTESQDIFKGISDAFN